jgi:hypothetical protein
MVRKVDSSGKTGKHIFNALPALLVIVVLAGAPILFLNYQSRHSGLTWVGVIQRILSRTGEKDMVSGSNAPLSENDPVFLEPKPVGNGFIDPPMISNIAAADLDKDGLPDIVVCDARSNFVSWIRQYPSGTFNENVIVDNLIAPAHAEVKDFDGDGDNDIMVAVLGLLFPSNDKIGSIVVLENDGSSHFVKHVIAENIARASDVRAGDLDGDGDMDLAAVEFGYDDGETRWMENLGNWQFKSHVLQHLSGPINVELVDIDSDGDLDMITLVSQEWEEIYLYVNDGKGGFKINLLYGSTNEDFGSSGIFMSDLDQDGDQDILYTNGDAFDYIPPQGKPWHGIQWLENKSNLNFEFHRICYFIGAYNARPVDIDGSGSLDLFAVSAFNLWDKPESQSFIWLENKEMKFTKHNIANNPTHIITMEPCDFNGDGLTDMATGGMHAYPPYDRMSRVIIWMNNGRFNP